MEKPILATNIDGLLLEYDVFTEPHKAWFERAIRKTKDKSLEKWIGQQDYFVGVNEAMKKILPNTSDEKRTYKARKWYQKDVVNYISNHPEKIKTGIAKKLKVLKEKYEIILLTSNTEKYINKILKKANLKGIYNGIIASKTEEEPNKEKLIQEFILRFGKPKFYLTGKPDDKINKIFEKLEIRVLTEKDIDKL